MTAVHRSVLSLNVFVAVNAGAIATGTQTINGTINSVEILLPWSINKDIKRRTLPVFKSGKCTVLIELTDLSLYYFRQSTEGLRRVLR